VARALRWRLWGPVYSEYPLEISKPLDLGNLKSMDWLIEKEGSLEIIKPPTHSDFEHELDRRIEKIKNEIKNDENKLSKTDKKYRKKKIADLNKTLNENEKFRDQLIVKTESIRRFLWCPICHKKNNARKFSNTENLFRVKCSCNAEWGLRDCSSCERPYPFIHNPNILQSDHLFNIDNSFGCDVLAFPNGEEYYCSHCGD